MTMKKPLKYPEIESLTNVRRVERQLASEGFDVAIMRWRDTAIEIARERGSSIWNHYEVYRELAESGELTNEPALRFVNGLLEKLPTQEARERLVLVQLSGIE